jgi:hypothetical protein
MNMTEIGQVLGISRQTLVRRIERERFSLVGIPFSVMKIGYLYDMEVVFQRIFPSADKNTISLMMYDFVRTNRKVRRKKVH